MPFALTGKFDPPCVDLVQSLKPKDEGMNYELVRELKEAGFPQDLGGQREERCYIHERGHMYTYENASFDVELYIPNLEELLEACGDAFSSLNRFPHVWTCHGYGKTSIEIKEGKTPTEAVARLWLALNKK